MTVKMVKGVPSYVRIFEAGIREIPKPWFEV